MFSGRLSEVIKYVLFELPQIISYKSPLPSLRGQAQTQPLPCRPGRMNYVNGYASRILSSFLPPLNVRLTHTRYERRLEAIVGFMYIGAYQVNWSHEPCFQDHIVYTIYDWPAIFNIPTRASGFRATGISVPLTAIYRRWQIHKIKY